MAKSVEKQAQLAYEYIKNRVFNPKTRLIYDHAHACDMAHFPTAEEVAAIYPNPCGYAVGMEDGMINGGTMVDACLLRYEKTGDDSACDFARQLVWGMLDCVACAKSEGFVPRGVTPTDEKSCYPDSSIDQYTMFVFGMIRFFESGLATDAEKERIKNAIVSVAKRAEKNPTAENDYDLLRDDGGKSIVSRIWGEKRGNHEMLRLPMIFAAAYGLSEDRHWLSKYEEIIDVGIERSLPMTEYFHMYCLQQMQASVFVCRKYDPDDGRRKKLASLSESVADYAESMVPSVTRQTRTHSNYNARYIPFRECGKDYPGNRFVEVGFPDAFKPERVDEHEFFVLQDAANVSIVVSFADGRKPSDEAKALFAEAFDIIDFEKHERCVPVHFLGGYYRTL